MSYVFFNISDKPGPPGCPQFSDITDTSIKLSWTPPTDDGGSPITNYIVEYKLKDDTKWKIANESIVADCSYVVKRLRTDSEYVFRVSAENRVGAGPPSANTEPILIKAPLGTVFGHSS